MNLRQRLTICALLLTCQHGDVVTLPLCKVSRTIAAEPEDDVNFPNAGNRWIIERNHVNDIGNNNISHTVSQSNNADALERMENINRPTVQATANHRQEPLLTSIGNTITQTQLAAAANARTTQTNLSANQAAPTTSTQHSNNFWQQFYPNQHSLNLAPTHSIPVLPDYPQNLRANPIFPTAQVLELSPQRLNTPSIGASGRAQRLLLTRRDSSHVAALPLYRHWTMPGNTDLNNPTIHSDGSTVQQRSNSSRAINSFTYLLD